MQVNVDIKFEWENYLPLFLLKYVCKLLKG